MEAKKCDRCGKFYAPENKKATINGSIPAFMQLVNNYGWSINQYDLCDDCVKDLQQWLKNKKVEE